MRCPPSPARGLLQDPGPGRAPTPSPHGVSVHTSSLGSPSPGLEGASPRKTEKMAICKRGLETGPAALWGQGGESRARQGLSAWPQHISENPGPQGRNHHRARLRLLGHSLCWAVTHLSNALFLEKGRRPRIFRLALLVCSQHISYYNTINPNITGIVSVFINTIKQEPLHRMEFSFLIGSGTLG